MGRPGVDENERCRGYLNGPGLSSALWRWLMEEKNGKEKEAGEGGSEEITSEPSSGGREGGY